jgi:hypothetical protein
MTIAKLGGVLMVGLECDRPLIGQLSLLATTDTYKHAQCIPDTLPASRDSTEHAGRISRSLQSFHLSSRCTSRSGRRVGRELGTAYASSHSILTTTSSLKGYSRRTSCKLLAHSRVTSHGRGPRREDQVHPTYSSRHSQGTAGHTFITTLSKHSQSRR